MAIAISGTSQSAADNTSGNSSITVNLPNGGGNAPVDLIMFLTMGLRGSGVTIGTPSGYTALTNVALDSLDQFSIFYRIFTSGTAIPATQAISCSVGTYSYAGAMAVAYSGINTSTPIDGSVVQTTGNTGSPATLSGVTTSIANEVAIWVSFVNGTIGTNTPTYSQGTTQIEVTRSQSAANGYLGWVDLAVASPSSTGTNTFTFNAPSGTATLFGAGAFPIQPPTGGPTIDQLMSPNDVGSNMLIVPRPIVAGY